MDHWKKCRDKNGKLRPPGWLFCVGCGRGAKVLCMVTLNGTVVLCATGDVDPSKLNHASEAGGGASYPKACRPLINPTGSNGEKLVLMNMGGCAAIAAILGEEGALWEDVKDQVS